MKQFGFFILFTIVMVPVLRAELRLPSVISDHMVLQQNQSEAIWGWDTPGTLITVSFAGQTCSTKADADGNWMTRLAPLLANANPQTLTITGTTKCEFQDIVIGEVWLCSGQSNMEMGVGMVKDGLNEIASANFANIRLLKVPKVWLSEPRSDQAGIWKVCTPKNIAQGGWNGFSAVAYFFGRELHSKLNVPVGLIDASWGGTRIETWIPPEGFAAVPALNGLHVQVQLGDPLSRLHKQKLQQFLDKTAAWLALSRAALTNNSPVPTMPVYPQELLPPKDVQDSTAIYNGMIHPVLPFGIRGAIWYQGEDNYARGDSGLLYANKMKALVNGWRKVWAEDDFSFYFVQIAPFAYSGNPDRLGEFWDNPERLAEFWEGQRAATLEIPNVGMAVINDIGSFYDIHPKNKQEVGRRLAMLALAKTYGQKEIVYSGPSYQSMSIEGSTLRVRFDHANGGLVSRDGQPLNWFEIIDADEGGFVKADAQIDGSSVVLSAPEVHHPVAMRFAWNQLAEPNLVNGAGLPTGTFRAGVMPNRDWLGIHVPEAKDYKLIYDLDLGKLSSEVHWDVDNHGDIHSPFDRIAYCVELENSNGVSQTVYVSMDAFTSSLGKIGIPTFQTGARFQQKVDHMNVFSDAVGVVKGTNLGGGNIEFWPNDYGPVNSAKVPNASSTTFDFGDEPGETANGYGSMQVHNHDAGQTLFAINHWSAGAAADIGIGNAPTGNSDWTFAANADNYKAKRLRIFVHCK